MEKGFRVNTLTVRLSTLSDTQARIARVIGNARPGTAVSTLNFTSYDHMHHVLAPSRIAILIALMGQGALSVPEVAHLVGRALQSVGHDVSVLVNAGVIDRVAKGIEFPYDEVRFEFDLGVTAQAAFGNQNDLSPPFRAGEGPGYVPQQRSPALGASARPFCTPARLDREV